MKKKLKKICNYEKRLYLCIRNNKNIIICVIGILNIAMLKRLKKSPIANIANSIRWQNIIIALLATISTRTEKLL